MAQTAAHLVDNVIPHVPVRLCVLLLPIPLRLLLAAPDEADSVAVTLIQRFGTAANRNVHLHCLALDGVYRHSAEDAPEFV